MEKISIKYIDSPLGQILLAADVEGVLFVLFVDDDKTLIEEAEFTSVFNSHLESIAKELAEFFEGKRKVFTTKLKMQGTEFQNKVWNELLHIPYGNTRTYLQQTNALGNAKAIRAVASANGKNKHAIVIPCHRVIGTDGSLTGYAGGLWRKKWLLEFEQKHSKEPFQQTLF